MATPVPETIIQMVMVHSQGKTWQCSVFIEDTGPEAGKYLGFAVNEDLDTLMTIPIPRILDAMYSVVQMVINRDCPIRNPAGDVKASRDYAASLNLRSPL